MNIFNKKSMFFFLAIALLICSSFADHLPQARMEERELAVSGAISGITQAFSKKLGELGKLGKWSTSAEKGFNVGIKTGDVYNTVAQACVEQYKCTPATQNQLCGGYCVYQMFVKIGRVTRCVKYCNKEEERKAYPQLKNCFYSVVSGRDFCHMLGRDFETYA